jgi:hypothetical protein
MEKSLTVRVEVLGARVASAWEGLRPSTRAAVERALATAHVATKPAGVLHDTRSEWELSRLLAALDERAGEEGGAARPLDAEQAGELVRVADACAFVLHSEARSAEVFAQLLGRALRSRDYRRVDALSDTLTTRLAPPEICELARHDDPALRAIAHEALAQLRTPALVDLLGDPVDAEVARTALELQADDYESEEARWVVAALDRIDDETDDEE